MSLRDQDARPHRHPAMDAARTMGIHLAPFLDHFQGRVRATMQRADRDGYQRRIKGGDPQQLQWCRVQIAPRPALHTHVDHQLHAEVTQVVVIVSSGRGADEEVIGDGGEIHKEIVS